MRWYFGLFFLALLGIPAGFAQNEMFTANPDQSEVAFSLGDVMHSVHRTFHVESGSVLFDLSSSQMSGSISANGDSTVQVDGVFTLHAHRMI